ncbi:MAG: hypothetical protein HZC19_01125 [Candidatus Omnitrophica bacterium]|nr:hypothetical protein [Candidatus Omnitrophota bacterium]
MTSAGLFRSSLDGTNMKRLSSYSDWPEMIVGKKFSPDRDKLLYFNKFHIWVIYMNLDKSLVKGKDSVKVEEVLTSPDPIIDVHWYSESRHIVFVTDKYINVGELSGSEGERNIVILYKFNASPKSLFYDEASDSLYFTDSTSSKDRAYLYRLDLRQNFFDQLMQRLKKEFEIRYEKRDSL